MPRFWTRRHERPDDHRNKEQARPRASRATFEQLYNEAKHRGVKGRSKMTKAQLEEALKR